MKFNICHTKACRCGLMVTFYTKTMMSQGTTASFPRSVVSQGTQTEDSGVSQGTQTVDSVVSQGTQTVDESVGK